jgi:hypothetical protein
MTTLSKEHLFALTLLAGAYPTALPINDVVTETWGRFIGNVEPSRLLAVVEAWIRSEPRAPSIADILAAAETLDGGDPETAWDEVCSILMGRRWDSPTFSCAPSMLAGVKAAGGWQVLRFMENKDRPWRKKEFIEGWKGFEQKAGALALLSNGRKELGDGV